VFVVYGTFCTIPTVESYGWEFFVPARTLIAVNRITAMDAHERPLFNELL